jgi:hypothetical protein
MPSSIDRQLAALRAWLLPRVLAGTSTVLAFQKLCGQSREQATVLRDFIARDVIAQAGRLRQVALVEFHPRARIRRIVPLPHFERNISAPRGLPLGAQISPSSKSAAVRRIFAHFHIFISHHALRRCLHLHRAIPR